MKHGIYNVYVYAIIGSERISVRKPDTNLLKKIYIDSKYRMSQNIIVREFDVSQYMLVK